MGDFRRKTPEEILKSISKLHRGWLKIYIGAVSCSGKTFYMLQEGQHLKREGIDVVIGTVTTKQRPETAEQIGNLERVPSICWSKNGREYTDLNLEALIKRNPEVVLVDGLAHRNREEARFRTRLEDIEFLLGRGISVITTINVYELRGATELARKWTGIVAEETVPAHILEMADETQLIDVSPEKILKRLENGYINADSEPMLFQRSNIGKLRELSLRLLAGEVGDSLERYRVEQGIAASYRAGERILVMAQYHWNGSIHIRRGQQIAKRLSGDLMIVTFIKKKRSLSREAAVFKRSILKLADKLDAKFEELPTASRRKLPSLLADYATSHQATGIVLGHSKQNLWQEMRRGSIANGIVKKLVHTDVYFVADRTEEEGERILPAIIAAPSSDAHYRRLSDVEMKKKMGEIKRGRFKVFIGAAPGVGKTYAMLREGGDLQREGIDVVIGLLEAHGRKDTLAQVGSLEILPKAPIAYRGTSMEELDVPAILRRNPEVVLIDELAHTNVPGSKSNKRFKDIADLLDAGISVISTMNIQHLESLNDAVEQITGIRVRETVPDHILHMADEIELIDVAPKTLQQRMREGKIYALDKVNQALDHFFRMENLIALRELALREIADDVDERLEAWERNDSFRGPWRRRETVFVGITLSSKAERLIRRGFRIAYRLKADWVVCYVHDQAVLSSEIRKRLEMLRNLTAQLEGKFVVLFSGSRRKIPYILLDKANDIQSTQMIVGQSKRRWRLDIWKHHVLRTILRKGRNMDVLVVSNLGDND